MFLPTSSFMNLSLNPAAPESSFPSIGRFRLMISKPTWDSLGVGVGEKTNISEPPRGCSHIHFLSLKHTLYSQTYICTFSESLHLSVSLRQVPLIQHVQSPKSYHVPPNDSSVSPAAQAPHYVHIILPDPTKSTFWASLKPSPSSPLLLPCLTLPLAGAF